MGKNTLKKFCRITKYLEQIDKDLYQVIDDLCVGFIFKPQRGSNGITFLYPKDKDYRQSIIKSAYSTDPDVAVNMLKSLVLRGYYSDASEFSGEVVNMLDQKLGVESATDKAVKLAGGLSLEKDAKFITMGYRENMAVYTLSGKGKIPLDGPMVTRYKEPREERTGGSVFQSSHKRQVQDLVAQEYNSSQSVNSFMKKVYVHLGILMRESSEHLDELPRFLGNEEMSDSYGLDAFCAKHCPGCFDKLYVCLGQGAGLPEDLSSITLEKYNARRDEALAGAPSQRVLSPRELIGGIQSPAEIRSRVKALYGADQELLGRDLFIVFTNIAKEMWMHGDRSMFETYAYLASRVYVDFKDLIKQEFEIAKDLSLWGNLLKSDVMLYVPRLSTAQSHEQYRRVDMIPSPVELELYSLSGIMMQFRGIRGGKATRAALAKYL